MTNEELIDQLKDNIITYNNKLHQFNRQQDANNILISQLQDIAFLMTPKLRQQMFDRIHNQSILIYDTYTAWKDLQTTFLDLATIFIRMDPDEPNFDPPVDDGGGYQPSEAGDNR